jgi:histone deacetylase 6
MAAATTAAAAARVGLLYDERMCAHATPDGEEHPENPERLRAIWRKLSADGVASRYTYTPTPRRSRRFSFLSLRTWESRIGVA